MTYNGSEAHKNNLAKAREKLQTSKVSCDICGKEFHKGGFPNHRKLCSARKECPVCGEYFSGKGKTCSHGCANTFFRSKENHPNWNNNSYRSTCFQYHPKMCIVCGEDKIVAVHHMDENRKNNSPENLIPLCPTHHQYFHSRYRHLVINRIEDYIRAWRSGSVNPLEGFGAGSIPAALTKK